MPRKCAPPWARRMLWDGSVRSLCAAREGQRWAKPFFVAPGLVTTTASRGDGQNAVLLWQVLPVATNSYREQNGLQG